MAKVTKKKTKKRKKSKVSVHTQIFVVMLMLLGIVFLPAAVILTIGLAPMFVAFFVDRSKKKTKAITVGAMNFAGCTPILMELFKGGATMDKALAIILDPMAIIVIYSAAGVGYIIDWAMTLIVAGFLFQRGESRQKAIEKRQAELIERWGEEVTGDIPLDHEGFPLDGAAPSPKSES